MSTAPAYRSLHKSGELARRAAQAHEALRACRLCPRLCGVDRLAGQLGFCGTGAVARAASAEPHFGEEPPLVGRRGSGTLFFSSCNLLCAFCQNAAISHHNEGEEVDDATLAGLMLRLQAAGCLNINLVTPSHVVPQILAAVDRAAAGGLNVPLVYNTGAYDSVATLRLLDGVIDIYMPDFKFWDSERAERYCRAPDYADRAREAIREMHRQVGDLVLSRQGVAQRGLLVRHLVMPGDGAGASAILGWLAELSRDTYVNVMAQYRPCGRAAGDAEIGRRPTAEEHANAMAAARAAGLHRFAA